MNLEKKATSQGRVPFAPMLNDSAMEVAVLPMKEWIRRKSLPTDTQRNSFDRNDAVGTNGYKKKKVLFGREWVEIEDDRKKEAWKE